MTDKPSHDQSTDQITLTRWEDPLLDQLGYDPRSRYVETYWLGILGPSTTLLLRHFADALDEHHGQATLDLMVVAAELGLGHRGGRNSPLSRSIQRAARFGTVRPAGARLLEVRRRIAPLNRGQVMRLPERLQERHHAFITNTAPRGEEQQRARRLALSLMECGDSFGEAEQQLGAWRVPEAVASDAVNWAWNAHVDGPAA